ncbi:signal transduction histidine kinase [Aurantimicrobium minutum]|uniref:hypothetical protein n=1 Tax=Aurantimicrobium minutum TaxID=708131 RepID=UPI0024757540|nr:hypothetical protein [Aurantimicrobium minutum]MDH6533075.1 signal transduction histidine kinase [Aurantimicrobium minutum]
MSTLPVSEPYLARGDSWSRSIRFGGPRATSQWIVIPVLLFLSLNSGTAGIADTSASQLLLLQITATAFVGAWFYFTMLGLAINRLFPRLGTSRNWAVGILYATTEMLRAVALYWLSVAVGLPTVADWLFRITGSLSTGIVLFGIVSTVLNDSASYASTYRELINQRLKLQAMINASQENLLRTRDQLIQNARAQISAALGAALSEVDKAAPSYSSIVDDLFHVTEDVVRPLSHDLFDNPMALVSGEDATKVPRVPLRTYLTDSSIASPFRPGVMVLISALLTTPSLLLVASWTYLLAWSVSLLIFYVFIRGAKKFIAPQLSRLPYLIRIVVIGIVFSIPAVIFTFVVFSGLSGGVVTGWSTVLYGTALGLALGILVSTSGGMRASRVRMLTEVSEINDQLYWLNVRLQSELWLDQKNLALTLHNDVQATLLAAALKLKASLSGGKISADAVMPEVKELISRSINFATAAPEQRSLADAISRINENWAGLIQMKYTAAEETLESLHNDLVTLGVLEDVLSEFQNNSLKHGQATETTVILTSPEVGVLQAAMSNNGHRLDTSAEGGLGSHFLKSVSLSYKLENYSRGVRLVVKLPVTSHDAHGQNH